MHIPRVIFGLVSVLAIAGTSCTPAQAVVPGASAGGPHPPGQRPGTIIQQWDHYCVVTDAQRDQVLAEAGQAGFELAAMSVDRGGLLMCFRRPVIFSSLPATVNSAAPGA